MIGCARVGSRAVPAPGVELTAGALQHAILAGSLTAHVDMSSWTIIAAYQALCSAQTDETVLGAADDRRYLGAGLSFSRRLHTLLQDRIQGILLLDQPFQLTHLPLNDAHLLLQFTETL